MPVLCRPVVDFLQPRSGCVYVDATLGGGGHAEAILEASAPDGVLLGVDRDPEALAAARARLERFGSRLRVVHATFDLLDEVARQEGLEAVHGVLLDLGVSSRQLDRAERGFSFQVDGPLDMRMDPQSGEPDASVLVNTLPERDLERILAEWGEERFAGRIARAIVRERERAPITTTRQLEQVVWNAVPAGYRHGRIHPATRTFQALRIAVNRELELLGQALERAAEVLAPGGRLAVIAYHSLEDRLVKQTFRRLAGMGDEAEAAAAPVLRVLTRKPVVPGEDEVAANPRARSAKLRVAEKIG